MGLDQTTQDVAKTSASSLSFFSKNVNSAVSKYNLEQEEFNVEALQDFARELDALCVRMYSGVQDPAERQGFEADYQKLSADWSKDLTKLFDKVLKLKGYTAQY
jgi:Skp family chaperone for outer membrane proteins